MSSESRRPPSPPEIIDQVLQQARSLISSPTIPGEVEDALRGAMQNAFNRMDIVSKEEFDAQAAVLDRSRRKLDELEQNLETMRQEIDALKTG